MRDLLFFPLRLALSLLLSLCHLVLLLGHLAFELVGFIAIGVFLWGGGMLAAGVLSLFHVPDGSGLWIFGVMIGMLVIGPLVAGSFLYVSHPGRWLEHRWQSLKDIIHRKIDAVDAYIIQAETIVIHGRKKSTSHAASVELEDEKRQTIITHDLPVSAVNTQSIYIRQLLNLYRDAKATIGEPGERQEENIRQPEIAPDFDTTQYTLGALCQRGHAWGDNEQSLLRINNSGCLACELLEFESFDTALRIVSAYGNVLATISPSQTYSSMTQLPVSKEDIRRSINLVYAMLGQATIRELVKHWYPEHAERLLSETFSQSLREGLADLPFFITDKEIELLTEMTVYGKEARAALQENRPCMFDMKDIAEKITTTSFITDITNIRKRILVERQQYLAELEQERETLAL